VEEASKSEERSDSQSPERQRSEDAVFIGWQKTPSGKVFALYNVTAESHPLHGSTVTEPTLREHNVRIPQTPPPETGGENFGGQKKSDGPGNYR